MASNKLRRLLAGLYALSLLAGLVRIDITPITAFAANGATAKLSMSLNGPDSISTVASTGTATVGTQFPVSVVIDTDGAAAHTLQLKASWDPLKFQFVDSAGTVATSIPNTALYKGSSKVLFNNYTVPAAGANNVADNTAGTFTFAPPASNQTDTDPQIYATSDVTGPTGSPVFAGPDRVVTFYLKPLAAAAGTSGTITFSTSAFDNQVIHYGEWGDLSGGVFTAQASKIYVDADGSNTVTTGDRRLTINGAFAADTVVACPADADCATALALGRVAGTTFRDTNANGTRDAAEPVYLNLDYPTGASATVEGTITAGDIRVIPGSTGAVGSTVAAADADATASPNTLLPLLNVKQTGTGGSGNDLLATDTIGTNLIPATVTVSAVSVTPVISLSQTCVRNNGTSVSSTLTATSGGTAINAGTVTGLTVSGSNVTVSPTSGTTSSSGQLALTFNALSGAATGSRTVTAIVNGTSVTTTITVQSSACTSSTNGVTVTKTHTDNNSPDFYNPGDTVNYRITIRNNSSTDITGVNMSDTREKGFDSFSSSVSQSPTTNAGTVSAPSNGPLTVTGATVAANSTRTISYSQDLKDNSDLLDDFNIDSSAKPADDQEWWAENVEESDTGSSSANDNEDDATGAVDNNVFSLGGSSDIVSDNDITRVGSKFYEGTSTSSSNQVTTGHVLLSFGDRAIVDGSGDDFVVITRNPSGDTDTSNEEYAVYASDKDDCNTFSLVSDKESGSKAFDLGDANVDWSACILIVDQTKDSNAAGPFPGVSVDGVGVINLGLVVTNKATVTADSVSTITATDKLAVDITNLMDQAFGGSTPSTVTGAGTTLSIPTTLVSTPGADIVVPLRTTQGQGISDFALSVVYDPTKLAYVSTAPSTATAGFSFIDNAIDGVNGMKELILGGNTVSPIAVSGAVDLALMHFKVLPTAIGATTFTIQNPINNIERAALANGRLTITAENFTVAPSPDTIAINAGSSDGVVLGDAGTNMDIAPSCAVYLSVAGLPSTITTSFSHPTLSNFNPLSILWLDVASTTPAGSYLATVTGSGISADCTNTRSASLMVIVLSQSGVALTDSADLSLNVTDPASGTVTTTPRVTIHGTVGSAVAFLEANGTTIPLSPTNSAWSAELNLTEGENIVSLVAYDSTRAKTTTASATITLDTKAPGSVRNLTTTGSLLQWDAPKDRDLKGYVVYTKSGSKWKKLKAVTKNEFALSTIGTYAVTSVDKVGNESDVERAPQFVSAGTTFSDVPADHFAATAIATLAWRGIIQGSGGVFRPNDPVTRAEFAKMLVGARKAKEDDSQSHFSDVSPSNPLAGFVNSVVRAGWAIGQGEHFYPARPVSRYEASVMIVRAANLVPAETTAFSDVADSVERQFIGALVKAGIASGQNGAFAPYRALTRAEAAKMVEKILVKS